MMVSMMKSLLPNLVGWQARALVMGIPIFDSNAS
jgi:hypothetical protein